LAMTNRHGLSAFSSPSIPSVIVSISNPIYRSNRT
jgi:hypothetical protein